MYIKNFKRNYLMEFTLNVCPTTQIRVRHTIAKRKNKTFVMVYKCKEQKFNELELEYHLMPHRPKVPLSKATIVKFTAYLPIPKSFSKKKREQALNLEIFPISKPDMDNLTKQLFDALTRMGFWIDDKIVFHLTAIKLYSDKPRWEVSIEEFQPHKNNMSI